MTKRRTEEQRLSDERAAAGVIKRLRELGLVETVERAAKNHGVALEHVCSPIRFAPVVAARHDAWLDIRSAPPTERSYPYIGWIFGVDYTTVMHGCKKAKLRRTDLSTSSPQQIQQAQPTH